MPKRRGVFETAAFDRSATPPEHRLAANLGSYDLPPEAGLARREARSAKKRRRERAARLLLKRLNQAAVRKEGAPRGNQGFTHEDERKRGQKRAKPAFGNRRRAAQCRGV